MGGGENVNIHLPEMNFWVFCFELLLFLDRRMWNVDGFLFFDGCIWMDVKNVKDHLLKMDF